jgi:DMSO reductase anchor subunit
MAQVYRLRSIPAWDTDRTLLAFAVSAILLGILGLKVVDFFADAAETRYPPFGLVPVIGLVIAFLLSFSGRDPAHQTARRLRPGLIGLGLVGMLVMYILPDLVGSWIIVPIFIIVLIEEGLGRWLFYEHLHCRNL